MTSVSGRPRLRLAAWSGAFLLLAAGSVCAQPDPYTHSSTPEEQVQTRALNGTAVKGSVDPADQSRYQEQLERYREEQDRYHAARHRYDRQRAYYDRQHYRYLREHSAYYAMRRDDPWALPDVDPPIHPRRSELSKLYLIAEPSQQLHRAPLVDRAGHWVGRVRNVETSFDGRPNRVQVYLYRDGRAVWVQPDALRYDLSSGVLFTDLSYPELRDLPGHGM